MDVSVTILRRTSGELFVHRRAHTRKIYPGLYGLGAGGKCELGETKEMGARRELFEETGIKADPSFLFSFHFSDPPQIYEMHIFELETSLEVLHDAREWQWSGWLVRAEIDVLVQQKLLCPDTQIFYERYIEGRDAR